MNTKNIAKRFMACLMTLLLLITYIPFGDMAITGSAADNSRNQDIIFKFLVEEVGLNNAAASGVLANIQHESGFDPHALGDSGTSYGICQWHNSRWVSLKNFCNRNGYDSTTLTGQLHYLKYELETDYRSTLNRLLNVSNDANGAYQAAYAWCMYFEVPADTQNQSARRGVLARDTYWPQYRGGTSDGNDTQAKNVIEKMLEWALKIADDNSHGYSQVNRLGNPDYDCSSFAAAACIAAGIDVPETLTTYYMKDSLTAKGFEWIEWSRITSTSDLKRGDILLDIDKHTEIYIGNNKNVGAHSDRGNPQGGDQDGTELNVCGYYNNATGVSWDGVLRYRGGSYGGNTDKEKGYYYSQTGVYRTLTELNVRPEPGTSKAAIGSLRTGTEVEVIELSGNGWGKIRYQGGIGWISLYSGYVTYVRELEKFTKPHAPSPVLETPKDVALNAINTVSWKAVPGAEFYILKVYRNGEEQVLEKKDIKGTSVGFTLDTAGSYTVKMWAANAKYTSVEGKMKEKIVVHDPVTVTFADEDDTKIDMQTVPYGGSAVTPAEMPTKKGFTFNGWDRSYSNVTEDITVKATYIRNKYSVTFYDYTGKTYQTQRVEYESAAKEPTAPAAPNGQVFMGWDKKFDCIESNLDIYPVFKWENENLPIVISDVTAVRSADGYTLNYTLTNYPADTTQLRLVAALKTSEGKLITTTESSAHNLSQSKVYKGSIYVPTTEVATTAEIMVVGKYTVTIPLAVNQKAAVTGSNYTGWSTNEAPADAQDVQSRTEYRYRTRTYTTSDQASLEGWTFVSKEEGYGDWGNWSDWTTNSVAANDMRQVETKKESKAEITGYNMLCYVTQSNASPYYRHYRNFSINGNYSAYSARVSYGEHAHKFGVLSVAALNNATVVPPGALSKGASAGYNKSSVNAYNFSGDGGMMWFKGDPVYNNYSVTYYRYRDRKTKTVYKYYRDSEYSQWATEKPVASDTCIVESRTTYRYIPADMNLKENTAGESRTISGKVDAKYAGKQASLFVYKYYDAADYTNEAVAQTVIGEDGTYTFTFKLREEPTYGDANNNPTGDFTVALGIEGTSNVIYLDPILAPLPEYQVTFKDHDGTVISEQTVLRGEDAVIPETVPTRLGYTFAGWSNSNLNIQGNTDIVALYVQNTYAACFIDWMKQTAVMQEYHYGDPILPPETIAPAGYAFKGWDALMEGEGIITENMVLTAVYEPILCTVDFVDYEGEIIHTQMVEFGKAAEIPEALEDDGLHRFIGWGKDVDLDFISSSITVKPNFHYYETTGVPTVSLATGVYEEAQTVSLTGPESAKIYYTLDGTDPLTFGVLYESPIAVAEHTQLRCYAVLDKHNPSEIVSADYAINTGSIYSGFVGLDNIPDYVKKNPSAYKMTDADGYRYLMEAKVSSKREADALESAGWTYQSESTVWSEWSEWSTSLTGVDDLMISVEQKDAEPVDTKFYQYEHWIYFDPATETYLYAPKEVEGFEGRKETIKCSEKLMISRFDDANNSVYAYNGQEWYNQTEIIEPVIPDVPLQRYRSETRLYTKTSDWTDTLPEGKSSEDADVETGKVFRYLIPNQYMLTILNEEGQTLEEKLVNADDVIHFDPDNYAMDGYLFEGLYNEEGGKWDLEKDVVTDNLTLTAKFEILKHTVTFLDAEGAVISTQEVESFADADAPVMEDLSEEEFFTGWSSNDYLNVMSDVEVTPVYQKLSEMPMVKLSQTKCYLSAGTKAALSVATEQIESENETFVWKSMDPEVAQVTDDGEIIALKSGETDVVVTELSTGTMAICMVSVAGTPDTEICVISTSGLSTTEEGTLTGVVLQSNAVEDVLTKFKNESLTVTDIKGNALSGTDLIGTGSVITLSDEEGNVIDSKTVVIQGDINGDGALTLVDAVYVLRYTTGSIELNEIQLLAADVTNDAYVGTMDADQIAAYLVEKGPFYQRVHS